MTFKNKTIATLLASLGGTLGLHRFYLHGAKRLLPWLYPLFAWTLVPTFIGFIEALRFALTPDDQRNIANGLQPMLKDIRVCLDRVNAQQIDPAVIARFEPNGRLSGMKIDAGGYDDIQCVKELRSSPSQLTISRAASVRCEYRCVK